MTADIGLNIEKSLFKNIELHTTVVCTLATLKTCESKPV